MISIDRFSLFKVDPIRAVIFLFLLLLVAFISFQAQVASPVLILIFLYTLGVFLIQGDNIEFRIFTLAFFVATAYSLFLYYYYISVNGAPYFNVPLSDDSSYERDGLKYAELLGIFDYGRISPTIVSSGHNSKGYVYFVGLIAKLSEFLGGYHTLLPRFVNSFIHAFSSVLVFRLASNYTADKKHAYIISLFFACFPHLVYLSAHIYRDTFICFAFAFCACKVLKDKTSIIEWIAVALVIIATFHLRTFSTVMLIVCILCGVLFVKIKSAFIHRLALLSIAGIALTIFLVLSAFSSSELELIQLLVLKQDHYTNLRTSSNYSTGLAATILKLKLVPFGVIARPLYLAINPLPFLNFKLPNFINGLGTLVQVGLFFFSFIFTYKNYKSARFLPLFLLLWGLFVGISLTSFQLRHMVMFYPFLFVLGGLGFFENYKRSGFLIISSFMVVSFGALFVWFYLANKLL